MSKNKQRRASAYGEGRHDGRTGQPFRWARHPLMALYRLGYLEGKASRKGAR